MPNTTLKGSEGANDVCEGEDEITDKHEPVDHDHGTPDSARQKLACRSCDLNCSYRAHEADQSINEWGPIQCERWHRGDDGPPKAPRNSAIDPRRNNGRPNTQPSRPDEAVIGTAGI